jgi:hypothetical protein
MAQTSKFSGALARLRPASKPEGTSGAPLAADPTAAVKAPEEPLPPPLRGSAAQPVEPVRGRGRPPGKRSDPDFKPTTLFLRTRTKRTAMRLLEDNGSAKDLSELVEELLKEWNKSATRNS